MESKKWNGSPYDMFMFMKYLFAAVVDGCEQNTE